VSWTDVSDAAGYRHQHLAYFQALKSFFREWLMRVWTSICLFGWLSIATSSTFAQAPKIDKIDPPGWWAGLPDPMLLVHGENLSQAVFTLEGKNAKIIGTQPSSNGHWAFLWLETRSAAAQTLWVTATNHQGRARRSFALAQRSNDQNTHRGFSSADVLYLIMTDRFADGDPANDEHDSAHAGALDWHGGDLKGIEQHLDYLQQLGVTALWTTPVASNGAMQHSYHGYAATDLYAVDSHFGTLDDYRHLSNALHAKGMKLVLDMVPNHLGVQHPWILDPPAPEWFHGTVQEHSGAQHAFEKLVDPHAPKQAWRDIINGWFTDAMPDLNQENPLVATYLIQNALWWVETANLDGIRLDTFPYVSRTFWHEFHAELHTVYPQLTTVGEIFNRDPQITSYFAGGHEHGGIDTGLDTPFDFPVFFTIRDVLVNKKPMTDLATVLGHDSLYPHPERLVTFFGNHDTTRFFSAAGDSVPKLKLALGLISTLRGMPQIYAGDEIAMPGGEDPDNRHDFPGGFAGATHNAFTKNGRTGIEQDVYAWTSGLLEVRAKHSAMQTGLEQDLFANENVIAYVRTPDNAGCASDHSKERMLIVANKAAQSEALDILMEDSALAGCKEFHAVLPGGMTPEIKAGKLHIEEPAESMMIYEVR
jgi:glycosidase